MCWSILTPYRAAHWNTKTLVLEDNPDPSIFQMMTELKNTGLRIMQIYLILLVKTKAVKFNAKKILEEYA